VLGEGAGGFTASVDDPVPVLVGFASGLFGGTEVRPLGEPLGLAMSPEPPVPDEVLLAPALVLSPVPVGAL